MEERRKSPRDQPDCSLCPLRSYFETKIGAVDEKLSLRLDAAKEAVDIARQQVDGRLNDMNHIRAQMREERADFVNRENYDLNHRNLETRLDNTRDRIISLEKVAANYEGRLWMLVATMGAIFTALQVILRMIWK